MNYTRMPRYSTAIDDQTIYLFTADYPDFYDVFWKDGCIGWLCDGRTEIVWHDNRNNGRITNQWLAKARAMGLWLRNAEQEAKITERNRTIQNQQDTIDQLNRNVDAARSHSELLCQASKGMQEEIKELKAKLGSQPLDLGRFDGVRYAIHLGRVVVWLEDNTSAGSSSTFYQPNSRADAMREWVAERILNHYGLSAELGKCNEIERLRDEVAKLKAKHQKLRDNIFVQLNAD